MTIVNKNVVQMFILTDKREGIYVVGECIYNLIHGINVHGKNKDLVWKTKFIFFIHKTWRLITHFMLP